MTGALIPKPFNTVIPIEKIQFYPSENKKKYILINSNSNLVENKRKVLNHITKCLN